MSCIQMMLYSLFKIKDFDVLSRCGPDALQYLRFIRYLVYYSVVNTLVAIVVILPVNYQGTNLEKEGDYFQRTTLINVPAHSLLLWIHVVALIFLYFVCYFFARKMSEHLIIFAQGSWTERTVVVKNFPKTGVSSERIKEYFRLNFPDHIIEDIKLTYLYKKLILANRKLRLLHEIQNYADCIKLTQQRQVMVKESCWCCCFCCQWPCARNLKTADEYYDHKIEKCKDEIRLELEKLPSNVLAEAFVTFSTKYEAESARNRPAGVSSLSSVTGSMSISEAADPANIIWENIRGGQVYTMRYILINVTVMLVAIFLTTPTIILSGLNFKNISENLESENFLLIRFLPTLIALGLSILIPSLVIYSSGFLLFETKSSVTVSTIKKSITFLLFSVVILPSFGLTSISAFVVYTLQKKESFFSLECVFLPDNGAFYVGYVMTSCFIGAVIQLIRIPEVLMCIYSTIFAKSEAERLAIRKTMIWEFSFGAQYSYVSLIFTLVNLYSIICPVMTIFGLCYFCVKSVVDRYNIYFTCFPSTISYKTHCVAINYILVVLIMKLSLFCLFFFVRGGWIPVTYVTVMVLFFAIFVLVINMTSFGIKYIPSYFLLPHILAEARKIESFIDVERTEREVYQPFALVKYIEMYKSRDEYGNPLKLEDERAIKQNVQFPTEK